MRGLNRSTFSAALVLSAFVLQPPSIALAGPLDAMSFAPGYPAPGGNHATFTATLPGLGLLLDGTDNRCDTDAEAGAEIAAAVFTTVATAEFGCAALPPGPEDLCFGAFFVTNLVAIANEIAKSQCGFHDAIIDGAEIEAAYENSTIIHSNLIEHDLNLSAHDAEIKANLNQHDIDIKAMLTVIDGKVDTLIGGQAETHRILHTPNGQRESIYYPSACGDADGCEWNNK